MITSQLPQFHLIARQRVLVLPANLLRHLLDQLLHFVPRLVLHHSERVPSIKNHLFEFQVLIQKI